MSFDGSKAVLIKYLSGNTVSVASGGNLSIAGTITSTAAISGETIAIWGASGRNPVYVTSQSGNLAMTLAPGNAFGDNQSFAAVNMTLTSTELFGLDSVANTWVRVRTTASGSVASQGGIIFRSLVDATEAGASVRINTPLPAISNSGGNSLGSGVTVYGMKIKHLTSGEGNPISGMVWVGGSGTGLAPFSGNGYPLSMGETLDLKTTNFNSVRVVAAVSGSLISAIGVGF